MSEVKPNSGGTSAFPYISPQAMDPLGIARIEPGSEGYLVVRKPWPAMFRTLWGDPERFKETYWSRFPGLLGRGRLRLRRFPPSRFGSGGFGRRRHLGGYRRRRREG